MISLVSGIGSKYCMHEQYERMRSVMSLKSAQSPVAQQHRTLSAAHEMQREDFLRLAAALRQFNAYQPDVSIAIAAARAGGEYRQASAME
ncbi:hypothetical protein ALP30_100947 [Pseudomonas syringae pv. primulae]|nr:hypothetical protein ALP30_100947 [Pseudomonas syringae pv. primulae]